MSGPLNGIGSGSQQPIFQPARNLESRQDQEKLREQQGQQIERAAPVEAKRAESSSDSSQQKSSSENASPDNARRGSVVNITV